MNALCKKQRLALPVVDPPEANDMEKDTLGREAAPEGPHRDQQWKWTKKSWSQILMPFMFGRQGHSHRQTGDHVLGQRERERQSVLVEVEEMEGMRRICKNDW